MRQAVQLGKQCSLDARQQIRSRHRLPRSANPTRTALGLTYTMPCTLTLGLLLLGINLQLSSCQTTVKLTKPTVAAGEEPTCAQQHKKGTQNLFISLPR